MIHAHDIMIGGGYRQPFSIPTALTPLHLTLIQVHISESHVLLRTGLPRLPRKDTRYAVWAHGEFQACMSHFASTSFRAFRIIYRYTCPLSTNHGQSWWQVLFAKYLLVCELRGTFFHSTLEMRGGKDSPAVTWQNCSTSPMRACGLLKGTSVQQNQKTDGK